MILDTSPSSIASTTDALSDVEMRMTEINRIGRGMSLNLGSAFADLTIKGRSFETVLNGLALRLSKLALNAAFKPLEQSITSGIGQLFSGTAFNGGTSSPLDASASSGGFTSQGLSAASAQPITINISTPDVESFRRSETQVAAALARSVARGNRNL